MCLRDQGIDNDDGIVRRVIRAHGLRNDDVGAGRGQGIDDASEGQETMAEAAKDQRQARGIYNDDGGFRGGR